MSFWIPPSANVQASLPVLNAELCSGASESLRVCFKSVCGGFDYYVGWKIIRVISGRTKG